ncbi:carbohydrate ABC transporter permease [Chelatococcus asaccharovorans]|uniref:Carbohydrate ABC transporter membrane protein 2 (CUT1 family) n=1 Tax=Chelatococcus asaccharovorans TaxID=28210 RepID=A0A2V3UEZ6_9HYPH|nr:carbohydrate ABC transporter permease [Chelatococcus asaccharovorans]MBS7707362.1 carbohydrate ABC transporter permease [Chelatococcus asaccharovorans]PXW63544.1 carbohydrate ABC transporter membrane protein 2 (CUT1 family) [Chelatococcus asaccharovorans]CAH1650687.1 Carbohydrate ABC transporter membrane protein 2 (CUT1 family) [Chelatococcus asaccharovorans]CAH1692465.1 Carbohydrate ABC transporter membrane protein 2 (CUT1 family) [Chelatococcus asaccharovorans]
MTLTSAPLNRDPDVTSHWHRRMFGRPGRLFEPLLILAGLLAILFALVYPMVFILLGSFKTQGGLLASATAFTWANYITLFTGGFGRFLVNSLVICVAATALSTLVSVNAAYVFSRFRFRGKGLIFGSVLFGQMFPWIVLVNPLFILLTQAGFTNSYTGMIFCYTAISIPFSVYMLTGYLATVPRELDEAALIDGASRYQVVWRIVFPVLMPGIVSTATYAFMLCWTEYLFALAFLTKPAVQTLPIGLYQLFGDDRADWGAVMAASVVTTIPTLLLFLPLQARLSSGLTAGAVK